MPQVRIIFQWLAQVIAHNWPVILWLTLAAVAAVRAFLRPSRAALALLYGFAGLAFVYEYNKHLAAYLGAAVDFLLVSELWPHNPAGHVVVEQTVPTLILAGSLGLMAAGAFGWWRGRARAKPGVPQLTTRHAPAVGTRPGRSWGWLIVGLIVGTAALQFFRQRR